MAKTLKANPGSGRWLFKYSILRPNFQMVVGSTKRIIAALGSLY